MTDPEDPEAKNEQELNLFSDQPRPEEEAQAEPEPGFDLSAEETSPAEPEYNEAMEPGVSPAEDIASEQDAAVAAEPEEQSFPAAGARDDDPPVVAPPPPRRKTSASIRPGVVVAPRAVRPAAPASSPVSTAAVRNHKPLPHALQADQPLGQMLASVRNARGMSLEEVAGFTRIRMEYLVELEGGKLLHRLPPVYISAYVRKLIEVYDLSGEDGEILLKRMRKETPQDPEELPKTLLETVNENTLVNEGETKRIRNYTVIFYIVIGIVSVALLWLAVLVIMHYSAAKEPGPGHDPAAAVTPGTVPSAEEPVFQTVHMDESELDALIVPETPSISVLKMSKMPGVRESL